MRGGPLVVSGYQERTESVGAAFLSVAPNRVCGVDDDFGDDLFGGGYGQDGPDLFGGADAPDVTVAADEPVEAEASSEPPTGESKSPAPAPERDPVPAPPPPPGPPEPTRPEPPAAPLALYRRYRPDVFADVIGQEHVTDPLRRALLNNRVNHAYLFSGPRGCGKTSSARIMARALNCVEGPTPDPCGRCQSCRDLARGGPGSIDVIEIDAASHGGVDDARDLRERAFFAPVMSRYKIYIIDEAHMVSKEGFNALLKVVEEPPPHVKFIFATTEPDKVIGTIRSRTHHYPFRLVPPRVLGSYLTQICDAEGVALEPSVVPLVVRAGAGSVRDSLSVLDQLLGGASEQGVTYGQAAALLGFTPESLLDEIVDAFAARDGAGVFAAVDKVVETGHDPRRFAEDLLRRLRDLVVVASVPDAVSSGLVDVAADQGDRLRAQAAGLGRAEVARAATVIAEGLVAMRGTTAPRLHLELLCARILLPGADAGDLGFQARLDRLERRLAGAPAAAAAPQADAAGWTDIPSPSVRSADPPDPTPQELASTEEGAESDDADGSPTSPDSPDNDTVVIERPPRHLRVVPPAPQGARRAPQQPAQQSDPPPPATPPAQKPAAPAVSGAHPLAVTDLRRHWPDILEDVKGRRRFAWLNLSQYAQVTDLRDGVLTLTFTNPGAKEGFLRSGCTDVLRESLVDRLALDVRVECADGPPADEATSPPVAPPTPLRPAAPAAAPDDPAPPAARFEAARTTIDQAAAAADGHDDPDAHVAVDDPDLDASDSDAEALLRTMLNAEIIDDETP